MQARARTHRMKISPDRTGKEAVGPQNFYSQKAGCENNLAANAFFYKAGKMALRADSRAQSRVSSEASRHSVPPSDKWGPPVDGQQPLHRQSRRHVA